MVHKIRIGTKFADQVLPISQTSPSEDDPQRKVYRVYLDEVVVFAVCCITAILILQLPMEYINDKPVPTVIFNGHPSIFHAFLISLMGSCCGSVCSIYLRERLPKFARFYYVFGVSSMVVALALFLWVTVPAGLVWVASKFVEVVHRLCH